MPRLSEALLELTTLIGLLQESGSLEWTWFTNPVDKALLTIPGRRAHLRRLLRALLDVDPNAASEAFVAGVDYEPFKALSPTPEVDFGVTWTSAPVEPMGVGLGARASFDLGGQDVALEVLAGLLEIGGGSIGSDLGRVVFGGALPVPPAPADFLAAAELLGTFSPSEKDLSLALTDVHGRSRQLGVFSSGALPWDLGRLLVFAATAWLRKQASTSPILARLDKHLIPLFGGFVPGDSPIAPFPLFEHTLGAAPSFDAWVSSLVTTENNAAAALTALWHLRALITGSESKDFFGGSLFIPLHDLGGPQGTLSNGLLAGLGAPGSLASFPGTDGAWLGVVEEPAGTFRLVLRLVAGATLTVDLLRLQHAGGWQVKPPAANVGEIASFLVAGALPAAAGPWVSYQDGGVDHVLKLKAVEFDGPGGAPGWALELRVSFAKNGSGGAFGLALGPAGAPLIKLSLGTGGVKLEGPDLGDIIGLCLRQLAGVEADVYAAVRQLVAQITAPTPDWAAVLAAVVALLKAARGGEPLELPIADGLALTIDDAPQKGLKLELDVNLAIPEDAMGDAPVHIGGVAVGVGVEVGTPGAPVAAKLSTLSFGLTDLRLGKTESGFSGLIGSLFPDLRELRGVDLGISWSYPDSLELSGGGKIPIQRTVGPLELSALLVELDDEALRVGLDGSLSLAGLVITPYELGLRFPFAGGAPQPQLSGLGISFDQAGLELTGMLARVGDDFVGAAVLKCFDVFELSAIGGYKDLGGEPSMFVFASLEAPLGGPPWFFVTGIAGGFGFNRGLAPLDDPSDHPLLKVMKGEVINPNNMIGSLQSLAGYFPAERGRYWIAAGIQFTSFSFIHGKVLLAIQWGSSWSITLLGSAAFGLEPIAYFELDFGAAADANHFMLRAGLSSNSYLIHPDIFSLRGDFGLAVWYGGPNAGDFVLSIGGYHPYFPVPEHYPKLDRVGVTATVYGFLKLVVEAYFAITPRAMMAGASVSLSAEFEGIGAGLDVYVDVLIEWDPFFMHGRMGVALWFKFLGRHEISVELQLWTPPLGGVATIDLAIVSFDVEFGSSLKAPPPPSFADFLEGQLGVALPVQPFGTEDRAGLVRVDVPRGRLAGDKQSEGQEGLTPAKAIPVSPEFSVALRSRLPADILEGKAPGDEDLDPGAPAAKPGGGPDDWQVEGDFPVPLCAIDHLKSTLWIKVEDSHESSVVRRRILGAFPSAHYGDAVAGAQFGAPGAGAAAVTEGEKDAALVGYAGVALELAPDLAPKQDESWVIKGLEEPSGADEAFPLPLATPRRQPWSVSESLRPKLVDFSRFKFDARVKAWKRTSPPPLTLDVKSTTLARPRRIVARPRSLGAVAGARMPVPGSPARRSELAEVSLRLVTPRPVAAPRIAPRLRLLPPIAVRPTPRPIRPAPTRPQSPRISVAPGQVHAVELGSPKSGPRVRSLTIAGAQATRVILLGRLGRPRGDLFRGAGQLAIPDAVRSMVVVGEGVDPPVAPGTAIATRAVGVEVDTNLVALAPGVLMAHGCVIEVDRNLPVKMYNLGPCAGATLYAAARRVLAHLPSPGAKGAAVITLQRAVTAPGSIAEQVAWEAEGATLGKVEVVLDAERVALVMPVAAEGAWALEVAVGDDWRLTGVVTLPGDAAAIAERLRGAPRWDLVDDRWTPTGAATSTVTLEVAR
ncbi:MAG: hypothetical protein KC636_28160 [Myxococcales bacterium]|nr:hypothetical protein [Myxococcales bacterium]